MPYTPEESDEIVRAMGKNPWEYTVREVDGVPHLVPTPTEGRGALEFGLRKLASDAPRAMTSAVGGKFGGAIAEPLATAAGTAIGGPLGGLAGFGVGALGFMGGGALATGAYDATLGKGVDDILLGSEQQQKRDAAEHPFVNRAAHIGSQLAGFKLLNPKVLGSGLAKLGTLSNLAVKDLGMNVAERAAVTGLAANPVIGGVTEAINQKVHGKPLDWKEIGISAASVLPFGDTRSKLGRIGTAMGNPFKYAAEKALGQPSSRPIKPRTIEPVQYPETAEAPPVMPTVRPGELSDVVSRENDAVREASTIAALANLEAEPPGLPAGRATGILADQMAAAREQAAAGQQQPPPPYDLEHNLGDILANVQTQMRNIRSAQEPPRVSILPQPPKIGLLPDMPLGGAKPLPPSRPSPFDRDSKAAILSAIDQSLPKVRPPLPPFEVPAPKWPRMSEPWRRTPTPFDADLEAARRAEVDKIAQAEQAREAEARAAEEQAQQLPADQLRQALQQNQILGAPEAPRSQVTPVSRPEFFGPDRGLPQEGPRTELETLQDWMEGRKVKFQGPKGEAADAPLASAADIAGGREALIRRGRRFGEVDAPIQMPDGRLASGFFHEPTGDIIVSRANTRPTTYEHEGMHAELQDMALSDNPAVQARAKELLAAVQDEEQLAELGAEASRAQRGQNRVLRLLRDNWNFFRTTKLGGGDMTPERAARMLATRFDFHAPELARSKAGGDVAYRADEPEYTPNSVIGKLEPIHPKAAKAVADFFNTKDQLIGGLFNGPMERLHAAPKELVAAVEAKRLRAMKTGVPPQFTAEEIPINAEYDRMMKASKDVADQTGYPIGAIQYYVPEMLDMQMARQISRNNDKFFNEHWGEFDAHNRAIYGSEYNPDDAAAYLRKYLKGVSKAPNSLGSDFGALTKNARQYHLPDNWRETDPIRALGRYGDRFAIQIAKRQHFLNDTELAQDVGMIPTEDNRFADIPEMQNARMAVENTLFNQGRGASGLSDNAKDLFTGVQRIAYSLGMQTLTGLKNTVQKLPFHLIHAGSAEELEAMMEGTLRSLHDYTAQREKALGANVIRPGQDPRMITDQYSLSNKLAKNFDDAANLMRKYTGAVGIENINRVHDYSIGEALTELHMEHPETPEAKKFFNRYGFGAAETMSAEKQISRMARNYAKSVQGSYGAEGLPAAMLKGGLMGQVMRINRFGIENMNRTYKYVLKPAAEGDFGPLLRYLFGAVLAAPVLQKMSEAITGKDSGLPTNEEIAAGQRNPMLEHIYNVMSMAQNTGTFGFASGVAGALAAGVRGKKQMVVGDPVITFGANAVGAVGAAIDAIQEGQPVVPTLLEASQRALIDNMQMLRRFKQDPELAQDRNTKSNFEYLNKRRKIPAAGVLFGMGTGNLFRPKPEINPTMDAAREGDREAYLKLSPEDRRRLDNYQGGFESPQLEAEFERWIEKTQGPGGLATYRARRQAAKLKAVPK